MDKCIVLIAMLMAGAAFAAPAWRWVDADGTVHYSDRPVPGATQIDLPEGRGFAAAATPGVQQTARETPAVAAAPAYEEFRIASPAPQETLWNIGGNLRVQIVLSPSLSSGHRLDLILDGRQQNLESIGTDVVIAEVFRGLHTVQAVIYDAADRQILRTQPVEFMVQQTSVQNPNNPNRPSRPNIGN